jgi:hypothetical protein
MKKIILFVVFVIGGYFGFAQNNDTPQFTKEEAIAIIKNNYLYMYCRYPEDTIANINRFIDNINEIIPINEEQSNKIKTLLLFEIRQTEKKIPVSHLIEESGWNLPNYIPIMGINANDIVKHSFNSSDYEKIYNKLWENNKNAKEAYHYLRKLRNEEEYPGEIIVSNWGRLKEILYQTFDYFGI